MIDDEAADRSQAAGPEVGAVTVAGEDQQVGPYRGGHNFPFDAAGALHAGARALQTLRRSGQQLLGGGGGQVFKAGTRVALGAGAAEQSCVGAVCRPRRFGARDMQQYDLGTLGSP